MSDKLSRRNFIKKGAIGAASIAAMGSFSAFGSSHLPEVNWQGPKSMAERVTGDEWVPPEGFEEVAEMIDKPLRVFNMGGMKFDPATAEGQKVFNEKTGIEVEPIEVPSPVALPKETTVLSSRAPEPVMMQVPAELYLGFVEPGWLEPTCELWDDATLEYYSKSWSTDMLTDIDSTRDVNCQYGTFAITELQLFHWRPDLLEEAGLDPAEFEDPTWDDIDRVGEALQGSDRYVFAVNGQPARFLPQAFLPFVWAQGGTIWEDGNVVFNSDEGLTAVEKLIEWVDNGYMPNPGTTDQSDVPTMFLAGKSVGAFHPTDLVGQAFDELGEENYMVTQPLMGTTGPDPQRANMEVPDNLCINTFASEERKLAAKIYADYRRSRQQQVMEFLMETNFPGVSTAWQDEEVLASKFAPVSGELEEAITYARAGLFPRYNVIADRLGTEIGNALAGGKSAQQALDDAQAYVDDALGQ